MNRKEFIGRVTDVLKSNNIRKPVALKKQEYAITDDNGNKAKFVVRPDPKNVLYTIDDVTNILDACVAVAIDAIQNGEEIFFKGFGILKIAFRAARRTVVPDTKDPCDVPERYVPKFSAGAELKRAARICGMNMIAKNPESGVKFYGEY